MLTFASGSALAATSTRCLVNAPATLATLEGSIPTGDTYMRVALRSPRDGNNLAVAPFCLFHSDIQTIATLKGWSINTSAFPSSGNMRTWDKATNAYVAGSETTANSTYQTSQMLVALRVAYVATPTAGYQITGIGSVGSGNVVSSSCATSLR